MDLKGLRARDSPAKYREVLLGGEWLQGILMVAKLRQVPSVLEVLGSNQTNE